MASAAVLALISRDLEKNIVHSRGESIGLTLDSLAGLMSILASIFVLTLILHRIHKAGWEATDVSISALFVAEIIQGLGHAMDLKWVIEGRAYTGTFCTAQAFMRQLGDVCTALATITIAVQTFWTIWRLKPLDSITITVLVGAEFCFTVLLVGIPVAIHTHPKKEYYAVPTPYWCWIGDDFEGERIAGQYFWFWLTLLVSCVMYIPLYLLHCRMIKPGTHWYSPKAELLPVPLTMEVDGEEGDAAISESSHMSSIIPETGPKRNRKVWSTIILYPIVYLVLVMPLSVVRWIDFRGGHTSPVATFAVMIILSTSGVMNAALYRFTRTGFFKRVNRTKPVAPATTIAP